MKTNSENKKDNAMIFSIRLLAAGLSLVIASGAHGAIITSGNAVSILLRDCSTTSCEEGALGPATLQGFRASIPDGDASLQTVNGTSDGDLLSDLPEDSRRDRRTSAGAEGPFAQNSMLSEQEFGVAMAEAGLGATAYPHLSAYAASEEGTRVTAQAVSVRRYDNLGDTAVNINFVGQVDADISGDAGLFYRTFLFTNDDFSFDTELELQSNGGSTPDQGYGEDVLTSTCFTNIVFSGGSSCSSGTLLIQDSLTEGTLLETGLIDLPDYTFALAAGESVFVGAYMVAIGANGGIADAFSTLTTAFVDPDDPSRVLGPGDGIYAISRKVPEPGTLGLLAAGLAGLLQFRRRSPPDTK